MTNPSDPSQGGLRRAGKLVLDWLLGPPSGTAVERPPTAHPVPATPAPPRVAPLPGPGDSRPSSGIPERISSASDLPLLYPTLRERILDVEGLLRRVKEAMTGLAGSYRRAVPPTRLQLCPWGFPKGTPPRALYWIRLAGRRQEACDDGLQVRLRARPNWFRRLKIRTRADLRSAVHWNGLDSHQATVLRYHDLASCLNRAHRILSLRSAALVGTFERRREGVRDLPGCPDLPLQELGLDPLSGARCRLRRCAWRLQWAVETDLARLNRLSGGPAVRLEAPGTGGSDDAEGLVWVNGSTRGRSLFSGEVRRPGSPADERTQLLRLLDARVEIVRFALSRLREIQAAAAREWEAFLSGAPPAPDGREGGRDA